MCSSLTTPTRFRGTRHDSSRKSDEPPFVVRQLTVAPPRFPFTSAIFAALLIAKAGARGLPALVSSFWWRCRVNNFHVYNLFLGTIGWQHKETKGGGGVWYKTWDSIFTISSTTNRRLCVRLDAYAGVAVKGALITDRTVVVGPDVAEARVGPRHQPHHRPVATPTGRHSLAPANMASKRSATV